MTRQCSEQQPSLNLTEVVMAETRVAYDILNQLGREIPAFDGVMGSEKSKALRKDIGCFALNMLNEGKDPLLIAQLEKTDEINEKIKSWTSETINRMTLEAVYQKYFDRERDVISNMLEGKTINAKGSEGRNLRRSNGIMESVLIGVYDIQQFTGPFYDYLPNTGLLVLGTSSEQVIASLFNPMTHENLDSFEVVE